MNKMNWKSTLAFAAVLIGATVLLDTPAWAGKPAPQPPTPLPPPVKYQVTWFEQIGQDLNDGRAPGVVWGMNDLGEVIGYRRFADGVKSAFRYSRTTGLEELDSLLDVNSDWISLISAHGINNGGQIVGEGILATANASQPFRLSPRENAPPLVEFLGEPQGHFLGRIAINNDGDVVGIYYLNDLQPDVACIWLQKTNGSLAMIDIQPASSITTLHISPVAIANRYTTPNGEMYLQLTGTLDYSAFRYTGRIDPVAGTFTATKFEVLPDLGGDYWHGEGVRGMNNLGDVAGWAGVPVARKSYLSHATRFPASGGVVDLGTLGGESWAYAINDSLQIVGSSGTSGVTGKAFLYVNGKMYNLEDLIEGDLTPWQSARYVLAQSINNPVVAGGFGQIAGTLWMPDGRRYGFLLTPKPQQQ